MSESGLTLTFRQPRLHVIDNRVELWTGPAGKGQPVYTVYISRDHAEPFASAVNSAIRSVEKRAVEVPPDIKPARRGPKPRKPIKRSATRPRRRARVRQQSRSARAKLTRRMDREWSATIREREERCERGAKFPFDCPGGYHGWAAVDAHHVISRRYRRFRWLADNGVALCRACHQWAHREPRAFRAWFREARPVSWAALQSLKLEAA